MNEIFIASERHPIVAIYSGDGQGPFYEIGPDDDCHVKSIGIAHVAGQGGYAIWFNVEHHDGRLTQLNAAFIGEVKRGTAT